VATAAAVVFGAALVTALVRGDAGPSHQMAIAPRASAAPPRAAPMTTTTSLPSGIQTTGQVQPPIPGLYRYRSISAGSPPSEYAEKVTPQTSPSGVTTDKLFSTRGVSTTVTFTPAGELEVAYSQVGTLVTDELTCPDHPPVLVLPSPLVAGASWTSSRSCTNVLGDHIALTSQSRVVGMTTMTVSDVAIPVWETVSVITDTDTPASGPTTTRQETVTQDVSAQHGVVVRVVTQQGTDPGTIETDRLVSVDPA
jgi:hypothetical protein